MRNTLIYARVSTADKGQNPEVQLSELRRYCKAREFSVSQEIIDHGYSGSTDNRPGLKKLMELARSRRIDTVVVVKLDRLFRSLKHLVSTLDEFQALGVCFISVKDNFDYSTPSGKLLAQILGSLGEFERGLIIERTRAGLEFARKSGKRLGRPPECDPERIRELRRSGWSYRKIKAHLNVSMGTVSHALKPPPKAE